MGLTPRGPQWNIQKATGERQFWRGAEINKTHSEGRGGKVNKGEWV